MKNDKKNMEINDENLKGMEDLLDNSSIGKLAKEVSEELDIESMIKLQREAGHAELTKNR